MKFIELAEKRCSIRSYKPDPVPEKMLAEILQAGNLAPTAKNLQPFHFIVVHESVNLDRLATAYPATMGLPEGVEPIALLPIGFPNAAGREKNRKSLKELVRYEQG